MLSKRQKEVLSKRLEMLLPTMNYEEGTAILLHWLGCGYRKAFANKKKTKKQEVLEPGITVHILNCL